MNESERSASKLVEFWRESGVEVNPGALESAIHHLEHRLRVQLPPPLRAYLAIADGMPEGSTDANMIRFWSAAEIVPLADGAPEMLGDAASEHSGALLFADYSLWAHAYAIQPDAPHHVLLVGGERPRDLNLRFEEFVDAYLSRGVVE
jgi:hypothetical protein